LFITSKEYPVTPVPYSSPVVAVMHKK